MSKIDLQDIRRQAFGRWPDILRSLGIPAEVLKNRRNQPCPCCGGTDRFQFIDKGTGRFVCRALDGLGGDGFTLVMHWLDNDFKSALKAIAEALRLEADVEIMRPVLSVTPAPKRNNSATIARLWREALPIRTGDPVARYLTNRGLELASYPVVLRHHPALDYWTAVSDKPVRLGTFPAMLAKVTNSAGKVVGLHRIYLTKEGSKASPLHPVTSETLDAKKLLTVNEGAMRGAAVRLYEPENLALAVTEGIETALAARLGSGLPCWAAVSAWGLENVALPENVTDVHIMADNDISGTGQRAAERLAKRLLGEGRRVRVHTPSTPDTDWLDVYQQRPEAAA